MILSPHLPWQLDLPSPFPLFSHGSQRNGDKHDLWMAKQEWKWGDKSSQAHRSLPQSESEGTPAMACERQRSEYILLYGHIFYREFKNNNKTD